MSCCAPGVEGAAAPLALPSLDEMALAGRDLGNGLRQVELSAPAIHCGACIHTLESALGGLPGVEAARVNLSTRRVTVRYEPVAAASVVQTMAQLGYPPNLADDPDAGKDHALAELLRAVGVSGFAAGNIMLLSVSVWSGAEGTTRDLFHWVSALIALPALAFAGRIYYRSAWSALRHGRMNMDVPIAIGISLAYAMSLYETMTSGPHAYFDAAVTLLFFLLIGRTLDHVMREKARASVAGLARLAPRGALVMGEDGERSYRPLDEIEPGMRLLVTAGERIPVDGRVLEGASDLDRAIVTGESLPVSVGVGQSVQAGTLNLTGPLTVLAEKPAADSLLSEMVRMMEAAEGGRARYRRIADRVSAHYAPVVHLAAFLTFLGWMTVDGDWHKAITIAIAVLIITCPCALGLAVPIVQVVAARNLFDAGIMVRDGSAMERLAEADIAIFDKTGTLTMGRPRLTNGLEVEPSALAIAAALGSMSRHPLAQAIAAAGDRLAAPALADVAEHAGLGIEARIGASVWRLGRVAWAAAPAGGAPDEGTVLARDGHLVAKFSFDDQLRPGACEALRSIEMTVGPVEMLSGDGAKACERVARPLGIGCHSSSLLPADKVARIDELSAAGHRVLMVGDGLNDAPALGAAHVSMAPSTAADVGRNAADFVFLRDSLDAVPAAIAVSLRAGQLVRQNLALAIVYNVIAVPIAVLGHVTPLIAALAMSGSSIIVIANAMRLGLPARAARASATTALDRITLAQVQPR